MGRIGWGEFLVILIVALVVVGPEKLPALGGALGKAVRSVKRYASQTARELDADEDLKSVRSDLNGIRKDVADMGRDLENAAAGGADGAQDPDGNKKRSEDP